MGKRKKLNRLISRWIKSDLPEDRSTVLLLGVTRIPTSPTPARRPCSLPLASPPTDSKPPLIKSKSRRRNSSSSRKRNAASRSSTLKYTKPETATPTFIITACQENNVITHTSAGNVVESGNQPTSPNNDSHGDSPGAVMDRSVDSIGTCSLDVEASVESSDWSEASSIGTLRSASIPATPHEPTKLPSYLSLACTVNGYSTTTNYDPERLARSRDASPHRLNEHHAPQNNLTTYTIHNNLLSPPNLVPLPIYNSVTGVQKDSNMSENTMATTHHRREFYSSNTKTTITTYINSESKNITSTTYSSDSVDSCLENGLRNAVNKCVKYEANTVNTNGTDKSVQDYSSVQEKSVIQQRVERLYGPGYLAQGFLLINRQKNKSYEIENLEKNSKSCQDKHSKSMNDQLLQDEPLDGGIKQSTSSPTLPVFRHLRPEFRAQLPVVRIKKNMENIMQKSATIPTLVDGVKINGHASDVDKESCDSVAVILNGNASINGKAAVNGTQDVDCDKIELESDSNEIVTKDGHYFLTILDKETRRLLSLAHEAEKELEQSDLPEEAKGYLRSASGKAKLLVYQKMQQFKGLCTNNIKQVEGEAFPTTNEDLQGFWDMIMLQVDQVNTLFKELDTLRTNNWQEQKPLISTNGTPCKPKKVFRATRPVSASAEENRKLREAQRKKMLEEKRKAMREQQNKPTRQSIEIFVPESS